MTIPFPTEIRRPVPDSGLQLIEIAECLDCQAGLGGHLICPGCGRSYPVARGIIALIGELRGRNRISGAFYDGPGWVRFRPWERLFLKFQGGEARARRQILRHVQAPRSGLVLEVGIGDGANLKLLSRDWAIFGVDISQRQLESCLAKTSEMAGRLALAEAEALPFPDGAFDACYTIGGFNYFADHGTALCEMRRVVRPGGSLVVADEIPNLHRFGLGHLIGFKALDAGWLRLLGLDRDFVGMVLNHEFDPEPVVQAEWPGAVRHRIWGGLGYCYVFENELSSHPESRRPIP